MRRAGEGRGADCAGAGPGALRRDRTIGGTLRPPPPGVVARQGPQSAPAVGVRFAEFGTRNAANPAIMQLPVLKIAALTAHAAEKSAKCLVTAVVAAGLPYRPPPHRTRRHDTCTCTRRGAVASVPQHRQGHTRREAGSQSQPSHGDRAATEEAGVRCSGSVTRQKFWLHTRRI